MWNYSYYPTADELYHHGILGQKWGKRNGPPYPLNASDHSVAEKKAGYKKSIASSGNVKQAKINKKNARKNAKNARSVRKERQRLALEKYNREEARIESKYKKGQNLSDKDYGRELEADKRLNKEWNLAKKQEKRTKKAYKDAKKAYKDAKIEDREIQKDYRQIKKEISKERNNKIEKSLDSNKKYQEMRKESNRLTGERDALHAELSGFSYFQSLIDGHYDAKINKLDSETSKIYKEAKQNADNYIAKKYGKKMVSEIDKRDHYVEVGSKMALAAAELVIPAAIGYVVKKNGW